MLGGAGVGREVPMLEGAEQALPTCFQLPPGDDKGSRATVG